MDQDVNLKEWFEATFRDLNIHVVNIEDTLETEVVRVELKGRLPSSCPWFSSEFMERFSERFGGMLESEYLEDTFESPELVSINQDPLLGPHWFRYVFKVKKIQP